MIETTKLIKQRSILWSKWHFKINRWIVYRELDIIIPTKLNVTNENLGIDKSWWWYNN